MVTHHFNQPIIIPDLLINYKSNFIGDLQLVIKIRDYKGDIGLILQIYNISWISDDLEFYYYKYPERAEINTFDNFRELSEIFLLQLEKSEK